MSFYSRIRLGPTNPLIIQYSPLNPLKAYTLRDTVTHYRIRTTFGKRQLLIEELQRAASGASGEEGAPAVRSSGTYRLSVYEDGKEVGTHEANIQLPEGVVSVSK